jgi:hypothetical protein
MFPLLFAFRERSNDAQFRRLGAAAETTSDPVIRGDDDHGDPYERTERDQDRPREHAPDRREQISDDRAQKISVHGKPP